MLQTILYNTISYYTLYYIYYTLNYTIQYYNYYAILYYTIQCNTKLYDTVLCTILYMQYLATEHELLFVYCQMTSLCSLLLVGYGVDSIHYMLNHCVILSVGNINSLLNAAGSKIFKKKLRWPCELIANTSMIVV